MTCCTLISLQSSAQIDHCNTHQTNVKTQADQWGMCGSRRGNENRLCAAVPHTVLRVRIVPDGRRQVFGHPPVGPGLGVAGGNELDARLLEGKDECADGAQAAEADQGELEARLGGHLFEYDGCVCVQDGGECASLGPAPASLIKCHILRISRNKYKQIRSCGRREELPGRISTISGPTTIEDIRSRPYMSGGVKRVCPTGYSNPIN